MWYKIYHGTINGKRFTAIIYDKEAIKDPLEIGLDHFFKRWKNLEIKDKIRKESDQGYLAIDSRRA